MDDWMVFALKNILRFDNISSNREFSINTKKWRQNVYFWRKMDEKKTVVNNYTDGFKGILNRQNCAS